MHDINFIRENPIEFDNFIKQRGEKPCSEKILIIDQEKRKAQTHLQQLLAERNTLSKEIGSLKLQNKKVLKVKRDGGFLLCHQPTIWNREFLLNVSIPGEGFRDNEYAGTERVREKFGYMIGNKGKIPEHLKTKKFVQRLLPKKWGNKGPTITATSLPDDFVHFSQARSLTVREWARLQTFPDWYRFAGKRTTGGIRRAGNPRESIFDRDVPKYTQIGNAVPCKLAERVAKLVMDILDERIELDDTKKQMSL